ncbi:MAG TPA: MBL fold metallo-hydrolase [Vicinamibacterales bacterium]
MRKLLLLLVATTAFAQTQTMRDAQKAFGAGDCATAQPLLREVIAGDPKNFAAHVMSGHCSLRAKDYRAAAMEFRHALDVRPDAAPAELGLIQAYALAGDTAQRDAEVAHLRMLIEAGKVPKTIRFVREQFADGDRNVVVSEYPIVSLFRSRYAFDVSGAQPQQLSLVWRDADQTFALMSGDKVTRVYGRGEPAYEQVLADVKAILAGRAPSTGKYALAKTPSAVQPMPITINDPADPRLRLAKGDVAIEFIAHSCFRIQTAGGARLLIDPYASRMWLGYDFPAKLAADAVLITHPHYDHDADVLLGGAPPPWAPDVRVMRDPGSYKVGDVTITGIAGKHADPWGKEFGQKNTIWLLETNGLRIAHLGDNGPLTDANIQQLGHVDIVMMPIDAKHHILKDAEIDAIRKALTPRVVIPMHYRIPDLEASADLPEGLGEIDPWLATQQNVVRSEKNVATFSAATLPKSETVLVLRHSPKVKK